MTTAEQIQDLDATIELATANIRRADRLGLRSFARQNRRERRALIEKRAALAAGYTIAAGSDRGPVVIALVAFV